MRSASAHLPVTIWMVGGIPTRMIYAGRRWRVSDSPTRLRYSIWFALPERHAGLYGWRFQGTDEDEHSVVFDVFEGDGGWHVHRTYE